MQYTWLSFCKCCTVAITLDAYIPSASQSIQGVYMLTFSTCLDTNEFHGCVGDEVKERPDRITSSTNTRDNDIR